MIVVISARPLLLSCWFGGNCLCDFLSTALPLSLPVHAMLHLVAYNTNRRLPKFGSPDGPHPENSGRPSFNIFFFPAANLFPGEKRKRSTNSGCPPRSRAPSQWEPRAKLTTCSAVPHSKWEARTNVDIVTSITLKKKIPPGTFQKPVPNPSPHRFGGRMRRKPPKTAVNARGEGPRRGGRPIYRQAPNFRADASHKSGFSLGAGVELGESFSAAAGPAPNASGGETVAQAGFGRRKISGILGDVVRARTTVVAPIRSADAAESPENSGKCKGGRAASWGATDVIATFDLPLYTPSRI